MQRWSFGEIELRFRRKGNGVSAKRQWSIAEKPLEYRRKAKLFLCEEVAK